MPRSVAEIEMELVELGYSIDEVRSGVCLRKAPSLSNRMYYIVNDSGVFMNHVRKLMLERNEAVFDAEFDECLQRLPTYEEWCERVNRVRPVKKNAAR